MVLVLTNKSVQNHGVIWGTLPKLPVSNLSSVQLGNRWSTIGQNAPTVQQIWGGSASFEP
jgi:hypothetical protein